LPESDIIALIKQFEGEVKQLKDEIYRLAWYMRGGVSAHDLTWCYSVDDREIISKIIKDNIETTNKTGIPLI
jgi:hypothetical protein